MKNKIFFLFIFLISGLLACNNNKNNNADVIAPGTDSSMIVKDTSLSKNAGDTSIKRNTDSTTANHNVVQKDSIALSNTVAGKMANQKIDKKSRKVKISIGENATVTSGNMKADKEGFYENTEVLPAFPGGQRELENFFEKNINYPDDATDNNIEGKVILNFAVDENGKVYAPKVVSKNIGHGIEAEALRVFNKMPVWTPGKIKGKNVKTKYTLPISFKLN